MSYSLYRPSGRIPFAALPFTAVCLALSVPLAVVYARLQQLLPAVLDFFLAFAFTFSMASAVKWVCASAKVRNLRWVGSFGLVLGLCGWYLQWAAWSVWQANAHQGFVAACAGTLRMAMHAAELGNQVLQLAMSESGGVLCFIIAAWLGELWMLTFFPHYMGKMRAEDVFDEATGHWVEHVELPNKFKLVDQTTFVELLSAPSGSLSGYLVPETDDKSVRFSRLRIFRCRDCEPLASIVTVERKEAGRPERVLPCFPGKYLYVPQAELDALVAGTGMSDPSELVQAIDCLQAGEFDAAYQAALPFVAAAEQQLYCDANRICAIACSELKRWPQAMGYWKALFAREASAHNALQVATSAAMMHDTEQGGVWIEQSQAINATSREMPSVGIITNMLTALTTSGQHGAAMPYLEQLRDIYSSLQVTDPTFLFGHRMPLFHVFLEKSGEIMRQALDMRERRDWYAVMLPHLDERGKAELSAWLGEEGEAVGAG